MKKCLIWGTGKAFVSNIQLLKFYEASGVIEVIGVTSNDDFYESILSYKYISKDQIKSIDFDYLICAVDDAIMKNIQDEAMKMGIDTNRMIPVRVMSIPGFDFEKYIRIRNNVPTIFSPHCWGGMTYNTLALPFNSPLINMSESHDDYLKLLKNIKYYMGCPLEFVEMRFEESLKRYFPVAKCGDIYLYFIHYDSFEDAETCWNRRKKRINWENMLFEYYDTDINRVNDFLSLPFEKKICFVPFPMEHKDVISIGYSEQNVNNPFWRVALNTSSGLCFDIFELLLNNEVALLSELKE